MSEVVHLYKYTNDSINGCQMVTLCGQATILQLDDITRCEACLEIVRRDGIPSLPLARATEHADAPGSPEIEPKRYETVTHPEHYNQYPVEAIDICEELSFNLGNALKYVWRAGSKPGDEKLEALRKAEFYLIRERRRFMEVSTQSHSQEMALFIISLIAKADAGVVRPVGVPDPVRKLCLIVAKMKECDALLKRFLIKICDDSDDFSDAINIVQNEIVELGGEIRVIDDI